MKQERKEELRMLAQRLLTKGEEHHSTHGPIIERYRELAESSGNGPAINDALVEKSALLIEQGRYCEALLTLEKRLAENPADLIAYHNWKSRLSHVHGILATLADTGPETAEYGRTYELLLQVGYVGLDVHLGAVRHFLASGQPERAADILIALARVRPNGHGVIDAIFRLAKVSDDVRIQKLRLHYERNGS